MRYYLNSGLLTICILLFFLPFIEIRCNGSKLGHTTGYDMAVKKDFQILNSDVSQLIDGDEYSRIKGRMDQYAVYTMMAAAGSAILLFIAAVAQLILKKKRLLIALIAGGAVTVILIILQIVYQHFWDQQMSDTDEMFSAIKFTLHFVTGYWLVVILSSFVALLNAWYINNDRRSFALTPYDPDVFGNNPDNESRTRP